MIRKNLKRLILCIFILCFCFNLNVCAFASSHDQFFAPHTDEYEPFDQEESDKASKDFDEIFEELVKEGDKQEAAKQIPFDNGNNILVFVNGYTRKIYGVNYNFEKLMKKLNKIDRSFSSGSIKDIYIYSPSLPDFKNIICISIENIRTLYSKISELCPDKTDPSFPYFSAAINMLEQIALENQIKLIFEIKQTIAIKGDILSDSYDFVDVRPYQRGFLIQNNTSGIIDFFELWYYICCNWNYHISDEPVFEFSDWRLINRGHIRYMYNLAREMIEEDILSPEKAIYAQLAKNMAEQIALENNFDLI